MWNVFVELSKQQLRQIARRQRMAIACIVIHMALSVAFAAGDDRLTLLKTFNPESWQQAVFLGGLFTIVVAFTILICLLGASVFGGPPGVVLGLLTPVPVVGIFTLLAINTRATALLRLYGIRVGFFGANREDLRTL